ncbi:MAG: site-2 protease family protein [Candidatus Shapirobacteria bacterium]|nr:site-2 protease family protein [Candidatus Shapirobacteria bacterium]
MESFIFKIISFICLIIAITIHEFSHALAADHLGDPTPRSRGRLTLNPIAHADLIGTIALPLINLMTGFPTIGWAKPVPIDPFNFRHPKKDEIIVSLAGAGSNLFLAIISSLVIRFVPLSEIFTLFFYLLTFVNISLFIFNLIPIPPLDGSHILLNLLPEESRIQWEETFDRYGFVLIIVLVFFPIVHNQSLVSLIISPIISFISRLLLPGF